MTVVNSQLNSCQLISRLQEGATAFPQTSSDATSQPPMCHVPTGSDDVQDSECICTLDSQTCGAGMANAPGALTAALRPVAAIAVPSSVTASQSVTLNGSGSAAANGHAISTYQWSPVSGGLSLTIQGTTTSKASVVAPSCGIGTVSLTVTDDAGRTDTANVVITATSATTSAPAAAGQNTCSLVPAAVQVEVCPATASVQAGSGSQAFSATLANTTNTTVAWQVDGIVGGNSTLGTISSAGIYTAPAAVPSPATITVSAVSAADSSGEGSAQVTVTAAPSSKGGGGALDLLSLVGLALALASQYCRRPRRERSNS
jgi:hypothetical protein